MAVLAFSLVTWRSSSGQLVALVALCLVSVAFLLKLILHYGDEFVNKPVTSPFKPRVRER